MSSSRPQLGLVAAATGVDGGPELLHQPEVVAVVPDLRHVAVVAVTSGHDSGLSSPRSLLLRRFKGSLSARPPDEIDEAFLTRRRGSTFASKGLRDGPIAASRLD
jgi:hypothetical protein